MTEPESKTGPASTGDWDQHDLTEQLGRLAGNLGWPMVAAGSTPEQVTVIVRRDGDPKAIEFDVAERLT